MIDALGFYHPCEFGIKSMSNETEELLKEFCDETTMLIGELDTILVELEADVAKLDKFDHFGQVIDRIRGSARSFNAAEICSFCELGKIIGIKAAQVKDEKLLQVVVAVLFDAVYILEKMVKHLRTGDRNVLQGMNTQAFITRLKWLSEKFKSVDISNNLCASQKEKELSQASIDDIMKSLGF
ncbi:MAG: hypothetical protein HQK50_10805 [Oligoflexia bacterium]|nr:hypothetical protein [Oligoflexia bacterium]MBF0366051.1 hypothetical protein [Oligoflexia bacterium]